MHICYSQLSVGLLAFCENKSFLSHYLPCPCSPFFPGGKHGKILQNNFLLHVAPLDIYWTCTAQEIPKQNSNCPSPSVLMVIGSHKVYVHFCGFCHVPSCRHVLKMSHNLPLPKLQDQIKLGGFTKWERGHIPYVNMWIYVVIGNSNMDYWSPPHFCVITKTNDKKLSFPLKKICSFFEPERFLSANHMHIQLGRVFSYK